jgi:PAS domain S-box-containing protein
LISGRASRIAATIGPAAVSLAIGVFAVIGVQRLAAVRESVTRARDITEALQTTIARLTDAESAQRGYLLTGARSYLTPGMGAKADVRQALRRARSLVRDSTELAQLDTLESVIGQKLAEMDSSIKLYHGQAGRAAAAASVRSDRNQLLTQRARELAGAAAASERARLESRTARERELTIVSVSAIFAAIVLAALLSLLSNAMLSGALSARESADRRRDLALAELERASGRVHDVLDSMSDGFIAFDRAWKVSHSNREAVRLTSTPASAIVGRTLWGFWGKGIPRELKSALKRAMDTRERDTLEVEVVPGRWFDIRLNPTADGLAVFFRDVTADRQARMEREQLIRQVEAEHQRLITVVEQSPLAITIAEAPGGRMTLANRQVETIFGEIALSASLDDYGRDWHGFHDDGRPLESAEWPMARSIATGQTVIGEIIEIERLDGARRRICMNSAPVRDARGRVDAGVMIFWDVTEQQKADRELRNARLVAETASRAKSEFLAVMSHELRTPLSAIIGYEELLYDGITGPITEPQRTQLARIKASAMHLLSLIDEVLTLSRVEAGREITHPERIPLDAAFREAAELAEPLAAEKRLSLEVAPPPEQSTVWADPIKLRQILLNLLTNAIKFTDRGRIVLEGGSCDGMVEIRVRDTGIGIAPSDQERIFDTFWQVEQQSTRKVGGTGLGLSVSRRLARLMNGELTVASALGEGSEFTLRLPAAVPS